MLHSKYHCVEKQHLAAKEHVAFKTTIIDKSWRSELFSFKQNKIILIHSNNTVQELQRYLQMGKFKLLPASESGRRPAAWNNTMISFYPHKIYHTAYISVSRPSSDCSGLFLVSFFHQMWGFLHLNLLFQISFRFLCFVLFFFVQHGN